MGARQSGGVVGTLEDTAADRLLDKLGVTKKVYDSQVEPYVDLGARPHRCRALGSADRDLLRPAECEAEICRPAVGRRALCHRVPQGRPGAGRAVRRGARAARRERHAAADLREWRIWNDDQVALLAGGENADVQLESRRGWSWIDCLGLLLEGPA